MSIERIVSGGQTGVDRAALDAALAAGVLCGGWAPKGRLDEGGMIPAEYPNLVEADSADPRVRTELNVRDSDATLIISRGPLTGGSQLTHQFASERRRPLLHLDLNARSKNAALAAARQWVAEFQPRVLNIAGPRASSDPEIYGLARELIAGLLERRNTKPNDEPAER